MATDISFPEAGTLEEFALLLKYSIDQKINLFKRGLITFPELKERIIEDLNQVKRIDDSLDKIL